MTRLARAPLLGPATRRLILPLLGLRIALVLGTFAALPLLPRSFYVEHWLATYRGNYGVDPPGPPTVETALSTFDAAHYLHIAASGYTADGPDRAYAPLWPALIRAAAPLAGGSHLVAGLVLANLMALAAWLLLHDWAARRFSDRVADRTLALAIAYPGSLFLGFAFSESLFLLLAVATFALLDRGRRAAAGAAAALLALVRMLGPVVALPIAVRAARERSWRAALPAIGPLLGAGAYLVWMKAAAGDPLAGFHIRDIGWQKPTPLSNLADPIGFARSLAAADKVHGFDGSAVDRVFFLWCLLALVWLARRWREHADLAVYTLCLGVAPAMIARFTSYTRYLAVVFPVFVATACVLDRRGRSRWLWVILPALALVQAIFLVRHMNHRWVG